MGNALLSIAEDVCESTLQIATIQTRHLPQFGLSMVLTRLYLPPPVSIPPPCPSPPQGGNRHLAHEQ